MRLNIKYLKHLTIKKGYNLEYTEIIKRNIDEAHLDSFEFDYTSTVPTEVFKLLKEKEYSYSDLLSLAGVVLSELIDRREECPYENRTSMSHFDIERNGKKVLLVKKVSRDGLLEVHGRIVKNKEEATSGPISEWLKCKSYLIDGTCECRDKSS